MPKPKASKFSSTRSSTGTLIKARGSVDPLAFASSAYLLTDENYVAIDKNSVWLHPKISADSVRAKSVDKLVQRFEAVYAEQAAHFKQVRAQKKERLAVLARTLELAAPAAPGTDAGLGELAPERKAEIAALLAEPPIDDTFGIARGWLESRSRR